MKTVTYGAVTLAMLAIAAAVLFIVFDSDSPGGGVTIVLPSDTPAPVVELRVYVSGAVRNPGVYTASEGDRLAEMIESAGGAIADADLTAVNLAVRVKDQDHWHIPKIGEAPLQTSTSSGGSAGGTGGSGKVDINTADASLFETLPGIGEVKAGTIVRYREANGAFTDVEQLLEVRGIGPATLDAIRELIEVR